MTTDERILLIAEARRCLAALVGNDQGNEEAWLHGYTRGLEGVPAEMMQTDAGLLEVVSYLRSALSIT